LALVLISPIGLGNTEAVAASLFYQFTLYSAVRLAHHGFTLGELSLVSFGATVLFMEMMNLTIARVTHAPLAFNLSAYLIFHVFVLDMVVLDTLDQNLPFADATSHLSACFHPRLFPRWVSLVSSTLSV
jgi:hypothetical protein